MYVLVEDTGVNTGFNLAANLSAAGVTPMIAKGPNMVFEPCPCNVNGMAAGRADLEEKEVVNQIVKAAEMKRIERTKLPSQLTN